LHASVTQVFGRLYGMFTELGANFLAPDLRIDHIGCIGNVFAITRLVGAQDVSSDDLPVQVSYKDRIVQVDPGGLHLCTRVGLVVWKVDFLVDYGFPEVPDGVEVGGGRWANIHCVLFG